MLLGGILQFIQSLGHTSIEVHEWQEVDVRKARLPNAPDITKLATQFANLTFSGWSLAHAVVKADYLDKRNLAMPGLGFLMQASNLIDFGTSPIELREGASKALNDVSLTSLSGRVGQGLAILYGHRLGLKFTAHLRSYVAQLPASSAGAKHLEDAMADFLFANDTQTVLVEAKGSFTQKENNPTDIKSVLKGALKSQIDPWMKYLHPAPSNGYVVYACLREKSWDRSAVFVVDPEGQEKPGADVPFTPDQVMRENYAAWLRAMGLTEPAERLVRQGAVSEARAPSEFSFFLSRIHGREYAFRQDQFGWPFYPGWLGAGMGLDLQALKAVSTAIQSSDANLAELLRDMPAPADEPQDSVSIFPDGSVFGSAFASPFDVLRVRL